MAKFIKLEKVIRLLHSLTQEVNLFINKNYPQEIIKQIESINYKLNELRKTRQKLFDNNPNKQVQVDGIIRPDKLQYVIKLTSVEPIFQEVFINVARELGFGYEKEENETILITASARTFPALYNQIHEKFEKYIEEIRQLGIEGPKFPVKRIEE